MLINWIKIFCSSISGLLAGGRTGVLNGLRYGCGASAPQPAAVVYSAATTAYSSLKSIFITLLLVVLASTYSSAAQSGGQFVNRAELHTAELPTLISTVAVTLQQERTRSTIEFLKYAPGVPEAVATTVPNTYYQDPSGSYLLLNPPVVVGTDAPINISAPVPLLAATLFHTGEPIFIKVTDLDQNLDSKIAETVIITITDPITGDLETLQLTESGTDSGIFIGYIQSSSTLTITANGALSVISSSSISAHYIDPIDGTDSSTAAALVDPYGLVFDTTTGKPVDGAKVELLNADGTPAIVYGDNGQANNLFPNSVISGGTAIDSDGNLYSFTPGGYRFPYVNPGDYILKVTPPNSYSSPSTVSTATIQTLPGAPFVIKDPGSREQIFTVPLGPAIRIDLPIDPATGTLWLSKSAGRAIVSAGEVLSYSLTLENRDPAGFVRSPVLIDKLPAGFRYQKGSARINETSLPDPAISPDGSTMTFNLPSLPPATTLIIRYVVAVGAGAKTGQAVNTAIAMAADSVKSLQATATVMVREPFMTSRSLIMGRVFIGACSENQEDSKRGMEGIGIYLEDGTFVISDQFGMFHFEGVKPRAHVVQLDLDSIPEGYKVLPCEQNSRFAGRAYSQFVDLQGGTLWRADFYLSKNEPEPVPIAPMVAPEVTSGEVGLEMFSSQDGDVINYRILLQAATVAVDNTLLRVILPPGASYIAGSSSIGAHAVSDPEGDDSRNLSYKPGALNADSQKELLFKVSMNRSSKSGELQTTAELVFDTPTAKGVATPVVDNLLTLDKSENRLAVPKIVIRPHFPTFGAELTETDRQQLDEIAMTLRQLKVDRIDVVGHTDSVRIAPRSRHIYADNIALSFARARTVGRYLTAALHLPPESLNLSGNGEFEPIASNRTFEGRALNRRVEITVYASKSIETTELKITKERSGVKMRETSGLPLQLAAVAGKPLASLEQNNPRTDLPAAESSASTATAETDAEEAEPQHKPVSKAAEGERVELISALNDGLINYRIKLSGYKETPRNITLTLLTPKSFLYVDGSSRLNSAATQEPKTDEAVITYTFTDLAADKKFDLRLQAIIDGDDQTEALGSSVNVVIADDAGKQIQTVTAFTELSGNMDEFNRVDTPPAQISAAALPEAPEIDNSGLYKEKIQKNESLETAGATGATATQHVNEDAGILSLADGSIIATRINAVRIVLESALTPTLLLDGVAIPSDRVGFSMADKISGKTLYTFIGVDFGEAGEHTLQMTGADNFGLIRFNKSVKYTRSGEIASLKLASADGNVADGRTPVRFRIQLFDSKNNLIPSNAELSLKNSDLKPLSNPYISDKTVGNGSVAVGADGWISFHPVTNSGQYRAQLAYNNAVLDIETYVKPKMRDWIIVGLAEGTVGYNTVSGNMENLKSSDQKEDLYDKERLALYAKGTIKGEWLLTMAYDSDKKSTGVSGSNALFQTIDPESYYSVYGDGSAQMYDAASQEKLYLRIERDQFYALFGDYNSGLTVTELSRYNRSMTGIKSEFRSKNFDLTAFGSETGQSFVKDEIRGDGTSGLYRLSRKGIVLNSDKITIESRDRFHSEVITNSIQLSRFIDYSIDYDTGAIFFKSPIASRDDKLNPVYIVVDYEILNAGSESLTYGGRAAARVLNGKVEVGGTYVREGQISGNNQLYGVDATAIIANGTKARVELATTDNEVGLNQTGNAYQSSTTNNSGIKQKANAYLAEVTHAGKSFDGRIYYKEQEQGFGLSQQSSNETGTRKFGLESGYRLNEKVTLNGQAYRQYNLADDGVRDFIEALATYNEKQYTLRSGLRYADDTLPEGNNQTSLLATVGASWRTLNQRLTLRADHDQALFSKDVNADFPTRTIFGADYKVTKATTVFAQEELTYGAAANTNTTRIGVKSTPWSGGTINSAMVNDIRENSERTFANVGLTQRWQVNSLWAVDGAVDHSETIREKTGYSLNSNVPPASGGENFTAVSLSANYTQKKLTWSNRVEYRNSDSDDKWGLISGMINEHGLEWAWTGRLQLYHTQSIGGNSSTTGDLRLGLVYRPPVTKWIVLNRLDLIGSDMKSDTDSVKGRRIVNNLHANWKPDKKTQLSLQYGAKYVLEKIDDKEYSGYTDLMGFEGRYDINKEWDLGMRSSLLHTWETDQYAYSFGPSVGYNVMENAWISVGYNFAGFTDKDFSNANYTAQGPYIQYRFKFDQNSVKDGLKALNQ